MEFINFINYMQHKFALFIKFLHVKFFNSFFIILFFKTCSKNQHHLLNTCPCKTSYCNGFLKVPNIPYSTFPKILGNSSIFNSTLYINVCVSILEYFFFLSGRTPIMLRNQNLSYTK